MGTCWTGILDAKLLNDFDCWSRRFGGDELAGRAAEI